MFIWFAFVHGSAWEIITRGHFENVFVQLVFSVYSGHSFPV